MKTKRVAVLPYDHKWKSDFEDIRKEIDIEKYMEYKPECIKELYMQCGLE